MGNFLSCFGYDCIDDDCYKKDNCKGCPSYKCEGYSNSRPNRANSTYNSLVDKNAREYTYVENVTHLPCETIYSHVRSLDHCLPEAYTGCYMMEKQDYPPVVIKQTYPTPSAPPLSDSEK